MSSRIPALARPDGPQHEPASATGIPMAGDRDMRRLLDPPVRWGYEYVEPARPLQSPDRQCQPLRRSPRMVPRAQAARLPQAAILAPIGAVCVFLIEVSLGVGTIKAARGPARVVIAVISLACAIIAFRLAQTWLRSRRADQPRAAEPVIERYGIPLVNAGVAFFFPFVLLLFEAVGAWLWILAGRVQLAPDPADVKRAEAEYASTVAAWQRRIAEFEAAEARRYETADLWYPVGPSAEARVVCVFGGTFVSWTSALLTLGSSMLGSGARLLIADLSRRETTSPLLELCERVSLSAARLALPLREGRGRLFAELRWQDLSSILVEVLHSAKEDADASRRDRQEDQAVIREVAACLDQSGPVSVGRLRQALRVVQGSDRGTPGIAPREYDELTRLYNEVQREHGGVMERVTRIERALRDFEALDDTQPAGCRPEAVLTGVAPASAGQRPPELEIIEVDKQADDLGNDQLVDLTFQLLLRRVRLGSANADVLVILGADRIRRVALESIVTHAQQRGVRIILFFEHLRRDAVELVGTGGAAAAFCTLGNHREAKEASDFIGSDFSWQESQRTQSEGRNMTETWGAEFTRGMSRNLGFPGGTSTTTTAGESHSMAAGRSSDRSVGQQRVREPLVEPEVLMGLPETGMVYVEVRQAGWRDFRFVDCNPYRRYDRRVASATRPPAGERAIVHRGSAAETNAAVGKPRQ